MKPLPQARPLSPGPGRPLALCLAGMVSAMSAASGPLGCAPSNQEAVNVKLLAAGTEVPARFSTSPTTELELQTADLAFGPFYLCASETAGELCDTARAEWLDSGLVNLLDPRAFEMGRLDGVSGQVASYMFDLGISSLLTHDEPILLEAAEALNGMSLAITGQALVGGQSIPFQLSLPIAQTGAENVGIPVVLSSAGAMADHKLETADTSLSLYFSVISWLEGIDLSPYVEDETCSDVDRAQVCAGSIAQACEDGTLTTETDCAASSQVCIAGKGCVDKLVIPVDSPAAKTVYGRIVTGPGPSLVWNED